MIPYWYELLLLTAAAWRMWALASSDIILDEPRDRFFPEDTKRREWLECPRCAGFWSFIAWIAAWWVWDRVLYAAVVFAGAAGVILIERVTDTSE